MAVLKNSIQLNDYVSPALRNICNAVNQTISVMERLNHRMGDDINASSLEFARNTINSTRNSLLSTNETLRQTQTEFDHTGVRGTNAFNKMTNALRNYITTYGVAMGARWLLKTSDEMSMINAKINMINNTMLSTVELNKLIFQTAQNARAGYAEMANTITRIRMNAGGVFKNTLETVQFAEVLNKQFKIAGATMEETNAATLQLTQALGSGVLRGDELNSVFESAPTLLQAIADYMNVPIGKIRQMAKEGQITADVIKNALLDPQTISKVNEQFSELPLTWQDLWVRATNNVKLGLMETNDLLSNFANSDGMLAFVDNLVGMTQAISTFMAMALMGLANIANFVYENWSMIAPVLTTVLALFALYKGELIVMKALEMAHALRTNAVVIAKQLWTVATTGQTNAQLALNTALYSCPLTWYVAMIMLVVGAFFLLIAIINKVVGINISAVGVIVGVWYAAGAIIRNIFILIMNTAMLVGTFIINIFIAVATDVQNSFIAIQNAGINTANALGDIFDKAGNKIFEGIAWGCNKAIDKINSVINLANKIPGVNIGTIGHVTPKAVHHTKASRIPYKKANYLTAGKLPYESISGAYNNGYNIGKDFLNFGKKQDDTNKTLQDYLNKYNGSNTLDPSKNGGAGGNGGVGKNTKGTANNTAQILEELKATGENIEYLRDLAEREVINRYTTAEIKIDMTNNNNINSDMDVDGVMRKIADKLAEELDITEEGVHIR